MILDRDLAKLYGVETKSLNLSVRRNIDRFPDDFYFQLSEAENLRFQIATSRSRPSSIPPTDAPNLRSQIVTSSFSDSKKKHGGSRYLPYAFTEQGVAMLSGVLRSKRAIEVNIAIMRTFVKLRQIISTHKELNDRLFQLEKKYDEKFRIVFDAIRELMKEDDSNQIGFDLN